MGVRFGCQSWRLIPSQATRWKVVKKLHERVADKIEADPALLSVPLQNIQRWPANGHTAPHRLKQWQSLLVAAQASS